MVLYYYLANVLSLASLALWKLIAAKLASDRDYFRSAYWLELGALILYVLIILRQKTITTPLPFLSLEVSIMRLSRLLLLVQLVFAGAQSQTTGKLTV